MLGAALLPAPIRGFVARAINCPLGPGLWSDPSLIDGEPVIVERPKEFSARTDRFRPLIDKH